MELQEWYGCTKSKKTSISAIIMLVTCKNTPEYKEYVINFTKFYFGEGVTIIDWLANMKPYVSEIVKSYEGKITCY